MTFKFFSLDWFASQIDSRNQTSEIIHLN